MANDDENGLLSDAELTPRERRAVRTLLRQDDRTRWLWSTARVWSIWITSVLGALYLGGLAIRDGLKKILGLD